jgi:protein transport protein SEC23
VRIQGAAGPCCSLNVKGPNVSDTVLMVGGTCQWQLSSCDPSTSLCMFLDVAPTGNRPIEDGKSLLLQFQTEYRHPSGQTRLRVNPPPPPLTHTTTTKGWMSMLVQHSGIEVIGFIR